jgi:hypothetical protein
LALAAAVAPSGAMAVAMAAGCREGSRSVIYPSPLAPPRHATPSNSETRKCYTQQVSPCLNGRHGSPQRLSNFGWRSVSYQEAPEMLIVLLGPPIAIFCRHDTRYFFDFSLSSTACYGSRAKDSRLTLGTATAVMELSRK